MNKFERTFNKIDNSIFLEIKYYTDNIGFYFYCEKVDAIDILTSKSFEWLNNMDNLILKNEREKPLRLVDKENRIKEWGLFGVDQFGKKIQLIGH
jgi:hypothetical protein